MGQRVLVTGATGYLGTVVCRQLHEAGFEVRANDMNLKGRTELPVKVKVADLMDRISCYDLVEDVEAVVHLGGHAREWRPDAQMILNENVAMTMNLCEAAAEAGVKRFVYASSIQAIAPRNHVHDDEIPESTLPYLPIDGDVPARPSNAYGLSKQLCEQMLQFFAREFGMSCVALRFPWLILIEYLEYFRRRGGRASKEGLCLDECRTHLSCEDAARLIQATLNADLPGFRVYLPTASRPFAKESVEELVATYYPNVELRRPAEEMTNLVDISKITEETGWVPQDDIASVAFPQE